MCRHATLVLADCAYLTACGSITNPCRRTRLPAVVYNRIQEDVGLKIYSAEYGTRKNGT